MRCEPLARGYTSTARAQIPGTRSVVHRGGICMLPLRETLLLVFKPVSARSLVRFYAVIIAGLASCSIIGIYLAQEHPAVAVLSSLLNGFAPVIGLFILLIILALLYSHFLDSIERIFTCEDDNAVPEGRTRNKWHIIRSVTSSPLSTHYLSLKEHSPPAL